MRAWWVAGVVLVATTASAGTPDARRTTDAVAAKHLGDAFRAYDRNDLSAAHGLLDKLGDATVVNADYVLWLRGMVALRTNEIAAAERAFHALGKISGSRFAPQTAWRLADCAWASGDRAAAAKIYARLIVAANAEDVGDVGTAMFRIAEAHGDAKSYRALVIAHPAHPLAAEAERRMLELGGSPLGPADRIERAKQLSTAHLWDEAIAELALVPAAGLPDELAYQRDYWVGTTLFDMRRRYGDAGKLLLAVAPHMGAQAAEAMFHGARALSRADHDDDAIAWYHKVVAAFPHTAWAEEAQFLSGWLEFNRGHYREAIAPLEQSLARYPHSKWVDDSLWFLAMAHYFLDEWAPARDKLVALAQRGGSLEGGKGTYWLGRIEQRLGEPDVAQHDFALTVENHPFSWYALLARTRLAELHHPTEPFGHADPKPKGPKLAATVDEALASDKLIARVDELLAADLGVDAGLELARSERAFLTRHDRSAAFAMLLDRYRKAGNFNRPWMLAVSYSGSALDGPADADARRWWENAYPRAYQGLVEKFQALGDNPEGYLYSIMRKESGFDPHDLSYADAQGLLQMIPPTTQHVAKELAIPYDPGKLYEPAYNVQTGSWYIGHLLAKFKGQIPIGAGSFNCGPRPVMKWLEQNGDRDLDELVELVPFTQTREYMKKVTENYARYRYLYAGEIYEQPLVVDKHYVIDQLTY